MASKSTSKGTKKQARKQCFKPEYSIKWNFIVQSSKGKGENFAHCTVCGSDFNIAHSGAYDIEHHIKSAKNTSSADDLKKQKSILQCFTKPASANYDAIRAETLWTEYVVEHNMPFAASDDFTDVVKTMFPDSKIAAQFACRRTKTTSIARALGHDRQDDIVNKLRDTPFSLSTDGSSDRGTDEQLYPVVVRYYDEDLKKVVGVLLTIATTEERSTGLNIFKLLDNVLKEKKIPWKNCLCFSADNASVMMGIHNGVAAHVRKENPDVFVLGCICHRLHLAAEKGAATLPFTPAELLTSIYYFLEKSSKRHKDLKGVQTLCGTASHKILKHVCTRWLSLESALKRLLEQWEALVMYFGQEAGNGSEKRSLDDAGCSNQSKKLKVHVDTASGSAGNSNPSMPKEIAKKHTVQVSSERKTSCTVTASKPNPVGCVKSARVKESAVVKSTSKGQFKLKPLFSCTASVLTPKPVAGSSTKPSSSCTASVSKPKPVAGSSTKPSSSCTASVSTPKPVAGSSTKPSSSCTASVSKPRPAAETSTKQKKAVSASCSISTNKGTSKQKPSTKTMTSTTTKATAPDKPAVCKAKGIHAALSVNNKLYCLFLKHTLPLFTTLNLELQKDAPMVHLIDGKLNSLLSAILLRFVKPVVIKTSTDLKKCQYKDKGNQRSNEDLMLGHEVREFIGSHTLSSTQLDEFFTAVRTYFTTVCDYIISTFPMSDDFLRHAAVANVRKRLDTSFSSISFFAKRFHFLEDKLDQLEEEFAHYQIDELDSIDMDKRADEVWFDISQVKDDATGQQKFVLLPKLMLVILSISHSNAEDERIFSVVRKNATEFRSSLSTPVLSDALVSKLYWQAAGIPCHKRQLTPALLQKCKKATMLYAKGKE